MPPSQRRRRDSALAMHPPPQRTTIQKHRRRRPNDPRRPPTEMQRAAVAYVHQFTDQDWKNRTAMLGSQRAMYDREKFEREFDPSSLGLSDAHADIYVRNPHMRQVFANLRPLVRVGRPMIGADRVLRPGSGRTPYARRQGEAKTVEHWGQRKLLLSEIEFLTHYGSPDTLVVYAGAAPGTHTNFLAQHLFPEMEFVLVDPAPFTARAVRGHVQLRNECFTHAMAAEFAHLSRRTGRRLLFVSDIRSMEQSMGEAEKEAAVVADMARQQDWVRAMAPAASMLKFRLPYAKGVTEYLPGDVWFPVWGPRTTSESRLIVTEPRATLRRYDHSDYEDAMFHFNTVTRTAYFEHEQRGEGLDHCYDCSAEAFILEQFVHLSRRRRGAPALGRRRGDAVQMRRDVDELSAMVTQRCSNRGRRLTVSHGGYHSGSRPASAALTAAATDVTAVVVAASDDGGPSSPPIEGGQRRLADITKPPLRPSRTYEGCCDGVTDLEGYPLVVFAEEVAVPTGGEELEEEDSDEVPQGEVVVTSISEAERRLGESLATLIDARRAAAAAREERRRQLSVRHRPGGGTGKAKYAAAA
eukprot:COSAG01_NODE_669_length_14379_cov_292.353011_3_plen_582_part_00